MKQLEQIDHAFHNNNLKILYYKLIASWNSMKFFHKICRKK